MPIQRKRKKEELDNGHYRTFIHRFQNFANVKKKHYNYDDYRRYPFTI